MAETLKAKTARTIKWNSIDRLSTQVLYAVVGVVLANVLSKEDFGLVGAILVFQAFAILFVDSGFGAALLQKKTPTRADYSTVFWFNLAVSVVIYIALYFCAPLIARIFQNDQRLIPMSRVMFLSFILNGLGIVQTNRLMKRMNVRNVAIANVLGLVVSGALAIWMALTGWGAWALVWQSVTLAGVKTAWLWCTSRWQPSLLVSLDSFRHIWRVGLGVFSSSFLNTVFLNVYSFVIGAFYSLSSLGVYTQADKWSKMGSASISQIFTASFVPLLSRFQDNPDDFRRYVGKVNRFAAFVVFPVMLLGAALATPLFHTLFADKWDSAILLFQILLVRGVFVVLISLYGNYLLSLGYAKSLVVIELVKDTATLAAIFATVWLHSVEALVWGQLAASLVTFLYVLGRTSRCTGYRIRAFLADNTPYVLLSLGTAAFAWLATRITSVAVLQLALGLAVGCIIYVAVLKVTGSRILADAQAYIMGRFKKI